MATTNVSDQLNYELFMAHTLSSDVTWPVMLAEWNLDQVFDRQDAEQIRAKAVARDSLGNYITNEIARPSLDKDSEEKVKLQLTIDAMQLIIEELWALIHTYHSNVHRDANSAQTLAMKAVKHRLLNSLTSKFAVASGLRTYFFVVVLSFLPTFLPSSDFVKTFLNPADIINKQDSLHIDTLFDPLTDEAKLQMFVYATELLRTTESGLLRLCGDHSVDPLFEDEAELPGITNNHPLQSIRLHALPNGYVNRLGINVNHVVQAMYVTTIRKYDYYCTLSLYYSSMLPFSEDTMRIMVRELLRLEKEIEREEEQWTEDRAGEKNLLFLDQHVRELSRLIIFIRHGGLSPSQAYKMKMVLQQVAREPYDVHEETFSLFLLNVVDSSPLRFLKRQQVNSPKQDGNKVDRLSKKPRF